MIIQCRHENTLRYVTTNDRNTRRSLISQRTGQLHKPQQQQQQPYLTNRCRGCQTPAVAAHYSAPRSIDAVNLRGTDLHDTACNCHNCFTFASTMNVSIRTRWDGNAITLRTVSDVLLTVCRTSRARDALNDFRVMRLSQLRFGNFSARRHRFEYDMHYEKKNLTCWFFLPTAPRILLNCVESQLWCTLLRILGVIVWVVNAEGRSLPTFNPYYEAYHIIYRFVVTRSHRSA